MKYLIPLILTFASLTEACSVEQHPADLTPNKQKTSLNKAQLCRICSGSLAASVRLPGQLKPYEQVSIFPKVSGFVKQLMVDRGDVVHKGQVLARLEAPEIESQLQTAMSKYDQIQQTAAASKERYNRLKEAAREPGAVAQLELDMAHARMKADEAAVQSEKANLYSSGSINKYLTITAPFDGIIVQRNVSEGALVGGNKASDPPMFILEASGKLRLEVMIPEDYVDKIDSKHPVNFSFNALTGKTFTAQISRMAKALGSERSEAIEIDVPNAQQQLKAGMYAEVNIPLSSASQSLIVPASAIVRSTERMYVVTEKNRKAHLVDIREGLRKSDSSEIFGQLYGGMTIMLHPTDDIKENDPIN